MHHYIATEAQDLQDLYLIWKAALLASYAFSHCEGMLLYSTWSIQTKQNLWAS